MAPLASLGLGLDRTVGEVSGGGSVPLPARPRALLLDEPAHHLDRASVRQLTSALTECRGALLVAAHDLEFLRSPGITRWLLLDGELRELAAGEVEEALKG